MQYLSLFELFHLAQFPQGLSMSQMAGFPFYFYGWVINPLHIESVFFIQSFVSGHLGGFHVFAIRNNDLMNMRMQVSFLVFLFPLDKYLKGGLLYFTVVLFLIFGGTPYTVFHSGCTKVHSHQQYSCCHYIAVDFAMMINCMPCISVCMGWGRE